MNIIILLCSFLLVQQPITASDPKSEIDRKKEDFILSSDIGRTITAAALTNEGSCTLLGTKQGAIVYKKTLSKRTLDFNFNSLEVEPVSTILPLNKNILVIARGRLAAVMSLQKDESAQESDLFNKANLYSLARFESPITTLDVDTAYTSNKWLCGLTSGECYWGDIQERTVVGTFIKGDQFSPCITAWLSANIAAAGTHTTLRLFDCRTQKAIHTINKNVGLISAFVASKVLDRELVIGTHTGTVATWDLRGRKTEPVRTLDAHKPFNCGPITCMTPWLTKGEDATLWGSMSGHIGFVTQKAVSCITLTNELLPIHQVPVCAIATYQDQRLSCSPNGQTCYASEYTPHDRELLGLLRDPSTSDDCSICLEPLKAQPVQGLFCQHFFHTSCLAEWLPINNTCPYCRTALTRQPLAIPPEKFQPLSNQRVRNKKRAREE